MCRAFPGDAVGAATRNLNVNTAPSPCLTADSCVAGPEYIFPRRFALPANKCKPLPCIPVPVSVVAAVQQENVAQLCANGRSDVSCSFWVQLGVLRQGRVQLVKHVHASHLAQSHSLLEFQLEALAPCVLQVLQQPLKAPAGVEACRMGYFGWVQYLRCWAGENT